MNTQKLKLKTKTMTLAVTGALAVMAQAATAQVVINTPTTGRYSWSTGDLTVTSTGSISGYGTGVNAGSNVGTLTNSGIISGGSSAGIHSFGTIGALINNGTISGGYNAAIFNEGRIGTLTNSGLLTSHYAGIFNYTGTIAVLDNTVGGTLSNATFGINNHTVIDTLTNGGLITASGDGINSIGTIGTLTNSGTITAGGNGIWSAGTIGTLTNSGLITGGPYGINNSGGVITALNNSGTIAGANDAIYSGAASSLGAIANSGVIAGNIANLSSNDLSISGGTGTIFGSLTGYGGGNTIGTITNTLSNVAFVSGNLLLNDHINVGSNAVNNNGTAVLQVNRPVTITGNYNQTGGTLQVGVAGTSTGQYGELVVTGNTTMTSGAVSVVPNGYPLAAGQRFVVVDTAGTANYGSGLIYSAGGLIASGSSTITSGHTDLVVTLSAPTPTPTPTPSPTPTPTPVPSPAVVATAPNAIASVRGLLSYTGISSPGLLNLYNAALGSLSQDSVATANRIGKQLAPTQTGSASTAPTFDALNVVGAHVDSLRVAQAGAETGVATGEGPAQWGVWGQAFGGHASQDEHDNVDGYSANYAGLLLGADRAINDRWRAGAVFSYSNTAINNTGDTAGDTTRVNSYGLIGYASFAGSPWYVNLSAAVSQQQYGTTRVVNLQGFSSAADGHYSGQQYVARAEAGYPLALGNATLTPLASLTYSYQNQGSYTESGGNGAALSVGSTHASSVKSSLGAKLEQGFSTSYGAIVPQLQAQWIHEYDHTRQTTGAGFAGDATGQTAFTTVGATPVQDLADISLGVTLLRANNLSLSVRYELQAASGFISQTGTLRLRQLF